MTQLEQLLLMLVSAKIPFHTTDREEMRSLLNVAPDVLPGRVKTCIFIFGADPEDKSSPTWNPNKAAIFGFDDADNLFQCVVGSVKGEWLAEWQPYIEV